MPRRELRRSNDRPWFTGASPASCRSEAQAVVLQQIMDQGMQQANRAHLGNAMNQHPAEPAACSVSLRRR